MTAHASGEHPAPERAYEAHAYSAGWRLVAATVFALSRASVPAMLLAILRSRLAVTPLEVIRTFFLFFVLPALAARVIARGVAARVTLRDGALAIVRRGLRLDVPLAGVAGVAPWYVPLPGPGFTLLLHSGRRLRPALGTADPTPLLHALAEHGVAPAAPAADHPTVVYARARAAWGAWRWPHLAARFPLFALGPTALLFNVHQHIVYGGLFGQYYMLGLGPYLLTFAVYWATVTIYHVLYAGVWRGLAEPICLLAAAVAPSRAAGVRRAAELAIRVLYYAGVPVLLALRFAPW